MIAAFKLLVGHNYGYQPTVGDECLIQVGEKWYPVMFAGAALGMFYAAPLEIGLRPGDIVTGIKPLETD